MLIEIVIAEFLFGNTAIIFYFYKIILNINKSKQYKNIKLFFVLNSHGTSYTSHDYYICHFYLHQIMKQRKEEKKQGRVVLLVRNIEFSVENKDYA